MLRLLSVSLLLFLAACNGGEDFSDAELGGQVLQPSPEGNPLNPEVDATEIVFVLGGSKGTANDTTGVVNNLGYACGNVAAYIPGPDDSNGSGTSGDFNFDTLPHNRARCPKDASFVDFFIGQAAGGTADSRVMLGRAWIPKVTNQGFYQFSPADLVESPSRVPVSTNKAAFMSALLQSLDSEGDPDGPTPKEIEIPPFAHEMVSGCCVNGAPPAPEPPFGQPDYSTFQSEWQPWMAHLDTNNPDGDNYSLPGNTIAAEDRLAASLARVRAGTYSAQSLDLTGFGVVLEELDRTQEVGFQVSVQVYPDGTSRAVGLAIERSASPESSVVALNGPASMSLVQALSDWQFTEVPGQPTVDNLALSGRMLGNIAYYDAENENVNSDYDGDYPSSDYDPISTDRARYEATAFGRSVSDGLYWLARTGQVAVNWDPTVLTDWVPDQANRFYDITFYRACTDHSDDSAAGCTAIPDKEIGSNLNYPAIIDSDGPSGTADDGWPVEDERPKADHGGDDSLVRVQILDNGDVVTDRDGDCTDVSGSAGSGYFDEGGAGEQEFRVGFVSRTDRLSSGTPASFNMVLLMSDDATDSNMYLDIPQFSTQVAGRVDLQDQAGGYPLYRLGETNFNAGIRAFWTDLYTPRVKQDLIGSDTLAKKHLIAAFSAGAAQGSKTDLMNDCSP